MVYKGIEMREPGRGWRSIRRREGRRENPDEKVVVVFFSST
jgi:hypothetical protein